QNWSANWGTNDTDEERAERDRLVHQLGNLTLVTQALNSSVSNAAWDGPKGKREALHKHTSLHLTRQVVDSAPHEWTPLHITQRTAELADRVLEIWPVPAGHVGTVKDAVESTKTRYSVEVADLIRAGMLEPGTVIVARSAAVRGREAVIGAEGSIYVDGVPHGTLSAAARAVTGNQTEAGWWFWLLDPATDRCMSDLRSDFLNRLDDSGDDD
ncbi:MAG: GmrSD restriction endonuclease domain-containing protein, partial [Microcella sp.]